MKIPNARLLNKEEFVSVCLDAAKHFLHDRRRASPRIGGGGGGGSTTPRTATTNKNTFASPREEYMLVKLLEAEVERRVGAGGGGGGGAVVPGHGRPLSMQYRDALADHNEVLREAEMYSAPPPLSNRVVVKELSFRNLKDEYSEYDKDPSATSAAAPPPTAFTTPHQHARKQQLATTPSSHKGTGGSSSFSVLHPIQISAVQFVKRILDPVYVKGMLTKQEYTDAVLSITTEGFSLAQRRELDLAPRSVDQEYEEEIDDDDDVRADQQTLSSAFAAVLQEIADSVALYYTSRYDAAKEAADAVAHEAVRTTHSVSVRPHRSRSPSSSQPKHSAAVAPTQHRYGDLSAEATTTATAASLIVGKRRSGSLGATSTNSSSHHCIGVDEDEAAFDAQVEHIRNLLSVSLGGNRVAAPAATEPPAPETSNNNNTTESINASPSSMRSRRKQVLESELKLLTLEMNTLAQRAYKIRDELANI
jgi:hypothetical protein